MTEQEPRTAPAATPSTATPRTPAAATPATPRQQRPDPCAGVFHPTRRVTGRLDNAGKFVTEPYLGNRALRRHPAQLVATPVKRTPPKTRAERRASARAATTQPQKRAA